MLEQVPSSPSRVRPLGSYQTVASFDGVNGALMQLLLSTSAGPLNPQGRGTLGSSAHFDGVANITPEPEPQLIDLPSLLGPRGGPQYRPRF